MKTETQKYTASEALKGEKIGTSPRARSERADQALRAIGLSHLTPINARGLKQASASEITIGSVVCLVSYTEIVAYRLPDGSEVATPHQHYSRTTDRSLQDWLRSSDVRRMQPSDLHDALRRRFPTV